MALSNEEPTFEDFKDAAKSMMSLISRLSVIDQGRAFQHLDEKID